jgi:hypothetical protein
VYPTNIHKALTLMNMYTPLKLDTPTIPAQGTTFVTGAKGNKKKGSTKAATGEYLKYAERNVLSEEEKAKVIEARRSPSSMTMTISQLPAASLSSLSPRCSSHWKRATTN